MSWLQFGAKILGNLGDSGGSGDDAAQRAGRKNDARKRQRDARMRAMNKRHK